MKKLKKHGYLVRNFMYAMAICFIWLLVETSVAKANSVNASEPNTSVPTNGTVVPLTQEKEPIIVGDLILENSTDWEKEYWNLIHEVDDMLDELDELETENLKKAREETKQEFITTYESEMPKSNIVIDNELLNVELKDYYSIAVSCTNIITGRKTTYHLPTTAIENNTVAFEMPCGVYVIDEINLYTLEDEKLNEQKIDFEPFVIRQHQKQA